MSTDVKKVYHDDDTLLDVDIIGHTQSFMNDASIYIVDQSEYDK